MSSNGITITTSEDEHGGTIVEITGSDLGQDTVTPEKLLKGVTAHDASGNPITGVRDSAVTVTTSEDEHGGTVVEITGVDISGDTVSQDTLMRGVTAHDALGNAITGTREFGGNTYLEPIELDVDLSVEEYDLEVDVSELEYDLSLGTAIQNIIIRGKLPPGGEIGDLLAKRSLDDYDVGWITPANHAEQDNTRPITAAAVYTEIGNINALLATI